jgi:hypothetical protein
VTCVWKITLAGPGDFHDNIMKDLISFSRMMRNNGLIRLKERAHRHFFLESNIRERPLRFKKPVRETSKL